MVEVVHLFFFFNDTATTEIYTLSLHDALPISLDNTSISIYGSGKQSRCFCDVRDTEEGLIRSEEHTSELQSQSNLVCRLLLEKKIHSSAALKNFGILRSRPSACSHQIAHINS